MKLFMLCGCVHFKGLCEATIVLGLSSQVASVLAGLSVHVVIFVHFKREYITRVNLYD